MKSSTIMRLIVRNRENIALLSDQIETCRVSLTNGYRNPINPYAYDHIRMLRLQLKYYKKALAKAVQDQVELKRELTWLQIWESEMGIYSGVENED